MKIALITPWENVWVPMYEREFVSRGHDFRVFKERAPTDTDVVIHGWASGSPTVPKAKNIVFLRRYELFDGGLAKVEWKNVQALICVNSWIKDLAQKILEENSVKTPVHLIYNAVDTEKWKFREKKPGKKIGMACFIHPKKNLPLALQILGKLPEGYELHIAGGVQDAGLAEYLNHVANAMKKVLYIYGQVPQAGMNTWWDMMDYCLSTSISEGNPNNVIEAMSKGIKPVVHRWPGSEGQFPEFIFDTVDEAVESITSESYDSKAYRAEVETRYSLENIKKVVDLSLDP